MKCFKKCIGLAATALLLSWAAGASAQEIVLGYTGPLSGPPAEYGQDCLNGMDMAVKEINAAGGITVKGKKYTLKLERSDDRNDPKVAVANAQRFHDQLKAKVVFNPVFGSSSAIMKVNQEKGKEFVLFAYTSSLKATQLGNKLVIVGAAPFMVYIQVYTDKAWAMGYRKCATLTTGGAYGDEWRNTFIEYWKKKGGTVTADKSANYYKETDFSKYLNEIIPTKPDFLLVGGPSSATSLVIEQARRMGFKGGFFILDQAKMDYIVSIQQGPKLLENSTGVASITNPNLTPASAAFNKRYQQAYRRTNTWEACTHYAIVYAFTRAMTAAGTVDDPYAIRAAFTKALPLVGDKFPSEILGVTNAGRVHRTVQLEAIKGGKFSAPNVYVWWAKTPAEFNNAKKMTKMRAPLIWVKGLSFE
jgi:branched-chain amino acid transport system substrate-binding protein